MPRKTKVQKKKLQLAIDGTLYAVTLRPPTGTRRTWYAYWAGAVYQRSTDQPDEQAAVRAAEDMLRRWLKGDNGLKAVPLDAVLTDAEFEEVQRRHYGRRTDAAARARAARSLVECLDAATAFKAITGLGRIAVATPDHCARFQHEALQKLRNWRKQHPKSKATTDTISPNTVLKWSRCLQAAFERVNRNAGKRCVRGVVPEDKLIAGNPWGQFTWIEGTRTPLRQFDAAELVSLLDFVEGGSPDVPVAALAVKVLLWSCCRKLELAGLTWDMLRLIGPADAPAEVHFDFVGKHGVPRWFRIPDGLYRELLAQRVPGRPEVFAAYTPQIRRRHAGNPTFLGEHPGGLHRRELRGLGVPPGEGVGGQPAGGRRPRPRLPQDRVAVRVRRGGDGAGGGGGRRRGRGAGAARALRQAEAVAGEQPDVPPPAGGVAGGGGPAVRVRGGRADAAGAGVGGGPRNRGLEAGV